jgi:hypothetical protein
MCRLNEMMIEILVDLARRSDAPPVGYSIVNPLRPRLRFFDAPSRRRLAELPFLLVDLALTDDAIWDEALRPVRPRVERSRRRSADEARSIALARGVTLLAWHVVHSNMGGAALHFGMSQGVADRLRRADVLELDAAATRLAPLCRPRWGDRPSAWSYLITRSDAEPSAMRDETVYGLQLLGSELLIARSAESAGVRAKPMDRVLK